MAKLSQTLFTNINQITDSDVGTLNKLQKIKEKEINQLI